MVELTLSAPSIYANRVGLAEMSHQDQHNLTNCSRFLTAIPIYYNGHVKIQRQKSPLQKIRCERVEC